ncbi:YbaB/EbfC family nucleoid-associated protein [Streptomyces sp. J2-1]|uniref:YbaB/EbfC family nucleoid-associated protein n=1 Tax=Streptomyces corallincola TaxID=2851888 RepID=UPI001C3902F6|nr:YbaB/EbfC family nucleoid-associated protein [Streptomyces corallincola]MBV2354909.1 YbaB/EbfC family nucleoid-associated protein [Streptomyces corallincola]
MSDELRSQLDQAMAEFETQRQQLVKARERIAAVEVTARSRDRAVEVTLGADGSPKALRFLDNRHKAMSGQELAASVLEVLRAAREELGVRVRAGFDESVGLVRGSSGRPAEDRLEGLGLDRLLDSLRAPGGPFAPEKGNGRG